jgi:hypothetical protein
MLKVHQCIIGAMRLGGVLILIGLFGVLSVAGLVIATLVLRNYFQKYGYRFILPVAHTIVLLIGYIFLSGFFGGDSMNIIVLALLSIVIDFPFSVTISRLGAGEQYGFGIGFYRSWRIIICTDRMGFRFGNYQGQTKSHPLEKN